MRHQHKRAPFPVAMLKVAVTKKASIDRRIIAKGKDDSYEYQLHATKGYRRRRI